MIKEALAYLIEKTEAKVHSIHELPYSDKGVTLVTPPIANVVNVQTLGALVALSKGGMDGIKPEDTFAQVYDHSSVHLLALNADKFGRRPSHVAAKLQELSTFRFGFFMEPEAFVIALQCQFIEDPALKGLLALASSLTAENVAIAEDDGISQTATVRQGISLKTNRKVEPKVKLRPYRTFREVEQPASTFLFRLRSRENQPPECALFEADGGAWKLEATENISKFLKHSLPKGVQVVF